MDWRKIGLFYERSLQVLKTKYSFTHDIFTL
jgi:hypothetical protein